MTKCVPKYDSEYISFYQVLNLIVIVEASWPQEILGLEDLGLLGLIWGSIEQL